MTPVQSSQGEAFEEMTKFVFPEFASVDKTVEREQTIDGTTCLRKLAGANCIARSPSVNAFELHCSTGKPSYNWTQLLI